MIKNIALLALLVGLVGCSKASSAEGQVAQDMNHHRNHGMNHMHNNTSMHDHGALELKPLAQAARPLAIPPILKADSQSSDSVTYSLTAMKSETSFKEGSKTVTTGYNGSFLGPILKIKKGQQVIINTANHLDEVTSFHWHGIELAGSLDGGPHNTLSPKEKKSISFVVDQNAATAWYHPHAMGTTASQVYSGLAGLIYIEDDELNMLSLPRAHGVDDIPLVLQDRRFDLNNQMNYMDNYNSDGVHGDTLLINGTINPYFDATTNQLRARLLNGSNARNYNIKLSGGASFMQIASDGGLLSKPVILDTLFLTPGERAEIIINLADYPLGSTVQLLTDDVVILTLNILDKQANSTVSSSTLLSVIKHVTQEAVEPTRHIAMKGMMRMVTINGKQFDMNRIDFSTTLGTTEIWQITNETDMMGGMIHPFHIHGVQFRVISRGGQKPPDNEMGWKDTIAVEVGEEVNILVKYKHPGVFMYHCHNLEHEENGMMGQFEVVAG